MLKVWGLSLINVFSWLTCHRWWARASLEIISRGSEILLKWIFGQWISPRMMGESGHQRCCVCKVWMTFFQWVYQVVALTIRICWPFKKNRSMDVYHLNRTMIIKYVQFKENRFHIFLYCSSQLSYRRKRSCDLVNNMKPVMLILTNMDLRSDIASKF